MPYNRRGFTLIELVIAMAILGVVVAVVSEGLWLGYRSWKRGSEVLNIDLRL